MLTVFGWKLVSRGWITCHFVGVEILLRISSGNWNIKYVNLSFSSRLLDLVIFNTHLISFHCFAVFILSSLQIYRIAMLYHKEEESSFLALFLDSAVSLICCAMVLASSIFITLGFIIWCGLMNERFPSCQTADGQNITKPDVLIQTAGFYNGMGVAQFGSWGIFATFAVLSSLAILKLVNNHQLRNLRVSMYLERQRLVNEDSFHNFPEPVIRQENMD